MRLVLTVFLITAFSCVLPAQPNDKVNALYWKKVVVPAEAKGNVSVILDFFMPAECSGFILCDGKGDVVKTRLLNEEKSHVKAFFNYGGQKELWLALIKDSVGHDDSLPNASGLLHVVRKPKDKMDGVVSVDEFMKLWSNSEFQGAAFVDKVFCGYNPFGNGSNTLSIYEGRILISKPGNYRFYSASTDSSFLLINGRPIVSWPGRHDPWKGANNEIFGDVSLQPGAHPFRYLHANKGEWMCAVAGYLLPDEKKNGVIPKEAFTPVFKAAIGQLEERDGKPVPEFTWSNRLMAFFDATCMHDVEFEAAVPAGAKAKKVIWDFGDGSAGEGARISHVYFKRWTYHVSMTVELADGKKIKQMQDVQVNFRFGQNENDDNATLDLMKRAVQQESTMGIPAEGYDSIMASMLFYKQKPEAVDFYRKSKLMKNAAVSELMFDFLDRLVEDRLLETEEYRPAVEAWDAFIARSQDPLKSRAQLRKAEILVGPLAETQMAVEIAGGLKAANLSDKEKISLQIVLADAALRKEGLDAAYYMLSGARKKESNPKDTRERLLKENAVNARLFLVDQLIFSGKYQEALENISALEMENPVIRLHAPLALLKGRSLAKLGRNIIAGSVLEDALLLDMDDNTDARTRLVLAGIYVSRKEYLKARQQISAIRKRSPGSLEEIEAVKLLEIINTRTSEGAK